MVKWCQLLAVAILIAPGTAVEGQNATQLVEQAVRTELNADAQDHSRWIYYEVDRKPMAMVKQWVAETAMGSLTRVLDRNGRTFTKDEQRSMMNNFIQNPGAQAKQRRGDQHDDQQATQMLSMLPSAFIWTEAGTHDGETVLHFTPDPQFRPPSWQARVFAAMAGEITVDDKQHRIVSLKGHLIHDVKFWGGLLGDMQAGGWFEVERREVGDGVWEITDTHVHIQGHALIFKTISEQEDDDKSKFKQLPANVSFEQAESDLMNEAG